MLHVVTLFTISDGEEEFVRSLRVNGDWHTIARRIAPELVATDLLRHQLSPLYICRDFWATAEAYYRGLHSPSVQGLFLARREMASACFELGAFKFPVLTDSGRLPGYVGVNGRRNKRKLKEKLSLTSFRFPDPN